MNQPWLTMKRLAGHRVGRERGAEQRGRRHVVDGGEFAIHRLLEHHVLDDLFLGDAQRLRLLGDLLVDQRRAHEAGADDVGAHAVLGAFLGHHLAQADQPVLGGDVRRLQQRGLLRVHRAHVDDAPAAARLVHVRQASLGGEEGAVQVNGEHLLPLSEGEVLDRMHDLDAGVADQDVDATEFGDHRGDTVVDRSLVADIHRHAHRLATACRDLLA